MATPIVIASNQDSPRAICSDGNYVYFTWGAGNGSKIRRVPINGGTVVDWWTGGAGVKSKGKISTDGSGSVFIADGVDQNSVGYGNLWRVTNGVSTNLITTPATTAMFNGAIWDNGTVYTTQAADYWSQSSVQWVPAAGGTATVFGSSSWQGYGNPVRAGGRTLYSSFPSAHNAIVRDTVWGAMMAAGRDINDVAANATYIVFADYVNYGLYRINNSNSGAQTPTLLYTGAGPAQSICLDSTYAYFIDNYSTITRVPLAGGAPVTLATGQNANTICMSPNGVLFWTNNVATTGTVMALGLGGISRKQGSPFATQRRRAQAISMRRAMTVPGVAAYPVPANVIATLAPDSVDLNWDVVPGASSYNIYRATSAAGPYSLIGSSTTNSYVDWTIGKNWYKVRSVVGGSESPVSGGPAPVPGGSHRRTFNDGFDE